MQREIKLKNKERSRQERNVKDTFKCTKKNEKMKKVLSILVIAIIFVMGCKKDEEVDPAIQLAKDKVLIQEYLTDNNITATETASGLFYVIDNEGTGTEYPSDTATVTIKYRGYLLDHSVFDETTGTQTATFDLGITTTIRLIDGMKEGIQLFKQGAKGRLFIPSTLAYGIQQQAKIPENSCLIFEIEIISFSND